jgi:hypothetical protein
MEARNAALDPKILVVVFADLLTCELLQPVCVLRLSWPGVRFLQATPFHFCVQLLALWVDASGRGIEKSAQKCVCACSVCLASMDSGRNDNNLLRSFIH